MHRGTCVEIERLESVSLIGYKGHVAQGGRCRLMSTIERPSSRDMFGLFNNVKSEPLVLLQTGQARMLEAALRQLLSSECRLCSCERSARLPLEERIIGSQNSWNNSRVLNQRYAGMTLVNWCQWSEGGGVLSHRGTGWLDVQPFPISFWTDCCLGATFV